MRLFLSEPSDSGVHTGLPHQPRCVATPVEGLSRVCLVATERRSVAGSSPGRKTDFLLRSRRFSIGPPCRTPARRSSLSGDEPCHLAPSKDRPSCPSTWQSCRSSHPIRTSLCRDRSRVGFLST